MVGSRSSRLNQNKPLFGPVSTLMSSSAEFYSFSLSGRLRAIGLSPMARVYIYTLARKGKLAFYWLIVLVTMTTPIS